eukprot:6237628-Amphidinium_carterae.1
MIPQSFRDPIRNATVNIGRHMSNARGIMHASFLSLYKTGHHYTDETEQIIFRLFRACLVPETIEVTAHTARTIVHAITIETRIALWSGKYERDTIESTTTLRATGTGHGVAKIALIAAIIAYARATGRREIE